MSVELCPLQRSARKHLKPHIKRAPFMQRGKALGYWWSCNGSIGESPSDAYQGWLSDMSIDPRMLLGNPRQIGSL